MEFNDEWVLVTGASSGIGREFAVQLAAKGAKLVLLARSRERLVELADSLGVEAKVVTGDLSTPELVRKAMADVDALGVPVRHVVNNAGMGGAGNFSRHEPEMLEKLTALNATAPMLITRHFLPKLLEAGSGGFIQIASTGAFVPVPFMAVYGATKAYVLSFSVAIAEEIRDSGVRITCVCPGPVPTEFQERAGYKLHGMQGKNKMSADEVVERALRDYERGEQVSIPGRMNALQMFAQRFVSMPFKTRAAGAVMRRSGRDKLN